MDNNLRAEHTTERSNNEKKIPLEDHLILRLPEDAAQIVSMALENPQAAETSMAISISENMRSVKIQIDDENMRFSGTVVDLPTLVETYKINRNNNSTVTKLANIGQMILCDDIPSASKPHVENDDYKWPSGLTPPMKNCRNRCFRKMKKQNLYKLEDEDELVRIFQDDFLADEYSYEVVTLKPEETVDEALKRLQIGSDSTIDGNASLKRQECESDASETVEAGVTVVNDLSSKTKKKTPALQPKVKGPSAYIRRNAVAGKNPSIGGGPKKYTKRKLVEENLDSGDPSEIVAKILEREREKQEERKQKRKSSYVPTGRPRGRPRKITSSTRGAHSSILCRVKNFAECPEIASDIARTDAKTKSMH